MVGFAVVFGSANRAEVYHRYAKGYLIRENFQNRGKRQIWNLQRLSESVFDILVVFVTKVIADIELRDRLDRHLPGIVASAMNRPVADKGIEVLAETKLVPWLKKLILQDAHMTAGRDAEWNPKIL